MLKNYWKHFCTVSKHKWIVFKLCCRAGVPWRGLVHDLSKFSPTEFIESAKYYQGTRSPIHAAREDLGYSKAWLHHRGRNKHHLEYWSDLDAPNKYPVMPYKYTVEMMCDMISASIVYAGKDWSIDKQMKYWENKRKTAPLNDKIDKFVTEVYVQIKENGINKTITRKNMKKLYNQYCG